MANGGYKINPAVILVTTGIASALVWFLRGGNVGTDRRVTAVPEFELGEQVDGGQITAIRSQWEYQTDESDEWVGEERL